MWRTKQNMILAVVKRNLKNGYVSEQQTDWLISELEYLQNQLDKQIKHEEFLLEELKKRGWPEDLF